MKKLEKSRKNQYLEVKINCIHKMWEGIKHYGLKGWMSSRFFKNTIWFIIFDRTNIFKSAFALKNNNPSTNK